MAEIQLTPEQIQVIEAPASGRIFLTGPAGAGKTTAAVLRLQALLEAGVPASSILVLVPQRTLADPYYQLANSPAFPAGSRPAIVTLGGLGQRLVSLFWPLVASQAGFSQPTHPPSFLTLETAQYYLAQIVRPLIDQGYFQTIKVDRNRLLSQILDNLNKAAGVGFPHTEIAERLKAAWIGEPAQQRAYEEAQDCANRFRQFCLEHNLLDFSLQMETFLIHLWPSFLCRQFLFSAYRHLIYENAEEDVPVVHDIIRQWLPQFESALVITDQDGGYRSFLGADANSAATLEAGCDQAITFSRTFTLSQSLETFRQSLQSRLVRTEDAEVDPSILSAVAYQGSRYFPEMIAWIIQQVVRLVQEEGTPPGEIAILAPFLPDSLRFSLMDGLQTAGIPARSHRPSRSLREEPATLCLLTLARLAHPQWNLKPSLFDVRSAFMQSIAGIDLVRADLLARIAFRPNKFAEGLGSFDLILPDKQERITHFAGEQYQKLRAWIEAYRQGPVEELDIFLSRLFGEVLSQPGFGFHSSFDNAGVAARLVESIRKFRWGTQSALRQPALDLGAEYIQLVEEGVVAAQYLQSWGEQTEEAVLLAPAYTFLLSNRPVDFQFWLDIGSSGWSERLYQPLTHPIVLSRSWPAGKVWTDADEVSVNRQSLTSLTSGLLRRCRKGVFLTHNRINQRGDEQRGPLLLAVQGLFRQLPLEDGEAENV